MKTFATALISLTLVFGLSGCSTIPVNQDYDTSANFSAIKKVQWLPVQQQTEPTAYEFQKQNPLIAKRIQNAIQNSLASRGVALVNDQADAFVTYRFSVDSKLRTDNFRTSIGFGFGSFSRHGGLMLNTAPDLYEVEEGKLVIDILDMRGNLIWRGISPSLLKEQSTPAETTQLVNAVVDKILSQYPPKPIKLQ
ncbi:MAG: DUF4136 domain-containing protein [Thiotrichales bacterium]|nr:DUF4136 domain-containing protein [Thiotrichales bacterium]